jgi:septal ring factor EnvC (AmiA/AmiB activator)
MDSTTETLPSASDSDDDELTLPPELLEREQQLIARNREVEARVAALLKSTSIEDLPPSQPPKPGKPGKSKRSSNAEPPAAALPAARASPTKPGIIEVEIPRNVEAVPEVRFDPVPELRQAFHKIAEEIVGVQQQIAMIESSKTKCEVTISKLQTDLKRVKTDNDRAQQSSVEVAKQLEASQAQLAEIKNQIGAARISRIERVQQEHDAKQKVAQLDQKVRRQRALADRLQSELGQMPTIDARAAKAKSDKAKLQQAIDEQKKAIRQLAVMLAEVQRASAHEDKVFDHIQNGRNHQLSSEAMERAIGELL